MVETGSTGDEAKSLVKRVTEIAGLLAVVGLIAQAMAYLVARGYYGMYGIVPDQLGITPLNAMLRMTFTTMKLSAALGVVAGLAILIPALVVGIRQSRRKSRGSHRRPTPERHPIADAVEAIRQDRTQMIMFRMTSAAVIFVSLVAVATYSYRAGADAADRQQRGVKGSSGILAVDTDLRPFPALVRWVKPEEFPPVLNTPGDQSINLELVNYLGSNNGLTYLWTREPKGVLTVPSAQVQIFSSFEGVTT